MSKAEDIDTMSECKLTLQFTTNWFKTIHIVRQKDQKFVLFTILTIPTRVKILSIVRQIVNYLNSCARLYNSCYNRYERCLDGL